MIMATLLAGDALKIALKVTIITTALGLLLGSLGLLPDLSSLPGWTSVAPVWTALKINRCIAIIASAALSRMAYNAICTVLNG